MKKTPLLILLLALGLVAAACGDPASSPASPTAQEEAEQVAAEREVYVPRNDVEGRNYSRRLEIADDPTTILWCTSAFSNPSSPLFTVPVVGKLTSGGKRPYSTETRKIDTDTRGLDYSPEVAGPDGFYGSSTDYRYGFTPGDFYADWTGLETFCTTEPLVWQREQTEIAMKPDPALLAAHDRARAALAEGDTDRAYEILESAVGGN